MLKIYDFECGDCEKVFEAFVEGEDGLPDECPLCQATNGFVKRPSLCSSPQTIIVDYPGSQRLKAGYTHIHNRPAEKKDSQVSMYTPKKSG
jgi:putative FmdB family regulatory protein